MDETQLLRTHMEDLAQKALRTGAAHSGFLSPSEAAQVEALYKARSDVRLLFDGGFAGAERKIAVFLQPDWGSYEPDDALAALALMHRRQDEVRHKDVMGAVLGLGLSRDVLGDICIEPGRALLVCLAGIAEFIGRELGKAGRVGVAAERLPINALPDLTPQLEEQPATVASLRLDAVVAAAFHLSRGEAGEAIRAGKVQLAHRECLQPAQPVREGDVISLRGKGRARLLSAGGLSRKGRLRIVLGHYTG